MDFDYHEEEVSREAADVRKAYDRVEYAETHLRLDFHKWAVRSGVLPSFTSPWFNYSGLWQEVLTGKRPFLAAADLQLLKRKMNEAVSLRRKLHDALAIHQKDFTAGPNLLVRQDQLISSGWKAEIAWVMEPKAIDLQHFGTPQFFIPEVNLPGTQIRLLTALSALEARQNPSGASSLDGFWTSVGANAQRIFDMALRTTDANLGVASRLVEGFGKKSLMLDGLGALSYKSAYALYDQMKQLIRTQARPAYESGARGEQIFLDEIAKLTDAFTQYEQAFRGKHGGPASAHGEAVDWLGKMQMIRNYAAQGFDGVRPHRRSKQARR